MSNDINADLSTSLRQLKVVTPSLDRDRLLYEAGRRSMQRSRLWPMATASSLLLAASTSFLYWQQSPNITQQAETRPSATVIELAKTPPQNAVEPAGQASPVSYLALREESMSMRLPVPRPVGNDRGSTPILSAASYTLPDWQRW